MTGVQTCALPISEGRAAGWLRPLRRGFLRAVCSRSKGQVSVRGFQSRQRNAKDRSAPHGGVNADAPAVLGNNTITDGESETRPAPDLLRREERIENPLAYLRRYALARVAHFDDDRPALILVALFARRAERERPALR